MTRPLTIAFQPFATSWLGHTSRLIAIAQGIRRRAGDARLIFIVDGNAGPLLETTGFPHLALPPEAAFAGPEWNGWPADQRDQMLGGVARAVLEQVQPRVMVFDSRPCTYIFEQAARMKIPAVLVARRTRTAEKSFDLAMKFRDSIELIIAPHDPGEVPVPPEIADKTRFVGTIVRDGAGSPPELPASPNKRVLITGGGGGFQGTVDYYNQALAAVRAAKEQVPLLEGTLLTGPMFKEWGRLKPVDGVTIIPFDPDMARTMASVDLVICQAGYNTMAELGELHTPTICVPAPRVADDQFARARIVARQREAFVVMTDFTTEALRDQIIESLKTPRGQPSPAPAHKGADRAAELILSLCANE